MRTVRRFVRVDGRGVHYIRAGEGPPVVLLHYATVSASFLLPLVESLASDHTVFALDHPGHGDSDPLEKDDVDAAEVADALSATLRALDLPPCPVYGSDTGAAVALQLGCRHPEQVSALILDGPCMFEPWEVASLRSDSYMPLIPLSHDGSHLLSTWVKTRDQVIWLPWNQRQPKWRYTYSLPEPAELHFAFLDMLRAGDGYRAVYRSAITNGSEAAAALDLPATFMASEAELLYSHLDRLPELKENQEIVRVPTEGLDFLGGIQHHLGEVAKVIRKYRVDANAPADGPLRPTRGAINRRYIDLVDAQVLVRSAGEEIQSKPLLMLHDGRGSSRVLEPLMRSLMPARPVYAIDLLDNGASDAHPDEQPDIAAYAESVEAVLDELGLSDPDVYAVGSSAAIALELVGRGEAVLGSVLLEAPDFYDTSFAQPLEAEWVPAITPSWDGAHLNRLWLMLRDEYAFWPWFDTTPDAVYRGDAPTDWRELHARVVEIVRSLATYHRLPMAALAYDWSSALERSGGSAVTMATTELDPRRPHVEEAAKKASMPEPAVLSDRVVDKASEILDLLEDRGE